MTTDRRHELLERLFRELCQTETSAERHPRREAARLGDVPPARALAAVSAHAKKVLGELPALARATGLPDSTGGRGVGALFSAVRHAVLDRLIDAEKSYRGTLLGMRHGLDVVRLLRLVADREGIDALVEWCDDWLTERTPLVEAVCGEMAWFADQPARALHHATAKS